ncbi:hypothetical protein FSHL1_003602 [Fusarium sambucinum]
MERQSTTWSFQSRNHALSQDDTGATCLPLGATEQSGALCYACRALTWGDFILQRDETSGVWRPKNILSTFHEAWTSGMCYIISKAI